MLVEHLAEFKAWKTFLPDYLYYFFQDIGSLSSKLDYSPKSLDVLEKYILGNFDSIEKIREKENQIKHEWFYIYIGETFVKNIEGAYWDLELNPDLAYFNLPVIRRRDVKGLTACPFYIVTTAIDRKKGDFISIRFHKFKNFKLE